MCNHLAFNKALSRRTLSIPQDGLVPTEPRSDTSLPQPPDVCASFGGQDGVRNAGWDTSVSTFD